MRQNWFRILPVGDTADIRDAGWRIRIELEDGPQGNATFAEEQTLPERVLRPDAVRVTNKTRILLTVDEVEWAHNALGELLAEMRKEQPK